MLKGFRDFVLRGNVVDLAVAVVIGAAFTAIVNALVADIINPLIAAVVHKPDFSALLLNVSSAEKSGLCTTAAINGLMISATSALTMAVNAAPMTTATARSTTLPRRTKSRNPLSIGSPKQWILFGRSARRFYFSPSK